MPGPHDVLALLLITCTRCGGEGYYETEEDGICNCPRCQEGLQRAAVPVEWLLSIYQRNKQPETRYAELSAYVQAQEPTHHPLLSGYADDLSEAGLQKLRLGRTTADTK